MSTFNITVEFTLSPVLDRFYDNTHPKPDPSLSAQESRRSTVVPVTGFALEAVRPLYPRSSGGPCPVPTDDGARPARRAAVPSMGEIGLGQPCITYLRQGDPSRVVGTVPGRMEAQAVGVQLHPVRAVAVFDDQPEGNRVMLKPERADGDVAIREAGDAR